MGLRSTLFATTTLALATGALATPALAQSQAPAPTPTEQAQNPATSARAPSLATSNDSGIADIIVTAQRTSQSSQRAAVPLDVIQGGALLTGGVTQVDRLNGLAPALSIQPTSTGNLIFLRGVGNFTEAPNADPAIEFNYDGVYVGRPTSTTGVFFDLDRVEVLKGPQGILYGRNATGGAINILPAQPKIGELSGYGSVAYGNYNTINAEGALNLPVGEKGALRLSLSRASHDGYLSDGTSDEDTWAGRAQLKAEVTPDLTIRVASDFAHNGGKGSGIDYVGFFRSTASSNTFVPSGLPIGTGTNVPAAQAFFTGVTFTPLGNHLPPIAEPYQDNMFYGVNAQIDYKTKIGTITVIPAWRDSRLNFETSAGGMPYLDKEDDNQYSVEARLAGSYNHVVDYQVGVYYYDEQIHAKTQLSLGYLGTYQRPNYGTKSYAGFGQATVHLADRLRVVGGLRFTQDNKTYSTVQTSSVIACTRFPPPAFVAACPTAPTVPLFTDPSQLGYPFPAVGAVPIFANGAPTGALSINADKNFGGVLHTHKLTYRGAVEFDLAPRSLLYASVDSGYRTGGFNAATGFLTYKPETITAFTLGMKNRFMQNKLQLNLEGFYWKYRNEQVTHVGPDLSIPPQTADYTQNIGAANIKGVEVDGKFLVTPTTLVSTDIQYLNTRQKQFSYIQGPTTPPITGCAVTGPNPNYMVNCSGMPSYNSPKWTLNFAAQQTINLDAYKLVLSADTQHRTSRYIGFEYLAAEKVGPNWTSNASVQFSPQNDHWAIEGYIRNIENHRIPIFDIAGGTDFLVTGTTAPRTYGIRLSAKY